jgi:hypothetical protein
LHNLIPVCVPHEQVFKDYNSPGAPISMTDETLFPEFYFPSDCVPDCALPKANLTQKRAKMEFHAVLDNLPGLVNHSPAMIERFGIMPEYYKVGNKYRGNGGEGKNLTEEQGNVIMRKSVVRFMVTAGFESATVGALDVLADVVSRHVSKLGRSLKILTDNYRKEFSAVDLLKMFLQASGCRWAKHFVCLNMSWSVWREKKKFFFCLRGEGGFIFKH